MIKISQCKPKMNVLESEYYANSKLLLKLLGLWPFQSSTRRWISIVFYLFLISSALMVPLVKIRNYLIKVKDKHPFGHKLFRFRLLWLSHKDFYECVSRTNFIKNEKIIRRILWISFFEKIFIFSYRRSEKVMTCTGS